MEFHLRSPRPPSNHANAACIQPEALAEMGWPDEHLVACDNKTLPAGLRSEVIAFLRKHYARMREMIEKDSGTSNMKEFFFKYADGELFAITGKESSVTSRDCVAATSSAPEAAAMCKLGSDREDEAMFKTKGITGHSHPCASSDSCPGPVPSPLDVKMIAQNADCTGFLFHVVVTYVGFFVLYGNERDVTPKQSSDAARAIADAADACAEAGAEAGRAPPAACGVKWAERMRAAGVLADYVPYPEKKAGADAAFAAHVLPLPQYYLEDADEEDDEYYDLADPVYGADGDEYDDDDEGYDLVYVVPMMARRRSGEWLAALVASSMPLLRRTPTAHAYPHETSSLFF